jgi:arylsulfatase A-like enzyme
MGYRLSWMTLALCFSFSLVPRKSTAQEKASRRPNIIVFVADGLRHNSVNEQDTPTLWEIRKKGVHFENSHSLFPTFTTANASAIATGHGIGDTGDFSNTIWTGYPAFDTKNFDQSPGTPTPFIENDRIISDMDSHFGDNYLSEETLLGLARSQGYSTAAIGKVGPTAIQDSATMAPVKGKFPSPPATIIVDDSTGSAVGIPLSLDLVGQLTKEGLPTEAPTRSNGYDSKSRYNNGYSGDNENPGTVQPNLVQQQWFADVATRGVLPLFASDRSKPFVLVFWSRDPDGTQHNQNDSGSKFKGPGINGPTSILGVSNADRNLRQLLDWLHAHPDIEVNTDVFVTSDHGFATISRREVDSNGRSTSSESAKHYYLDGTGRQETKKGTLPVGFLAIDLAIGLKTKLFDPDRPASAESGSFYKQIRLVPDCASWEHPILGNGFLGDAIGRADGSDAMLIVASNGGSDLIYVPNRNPDMVRQIVHLLLGFDYVGGIFVDGESYGEVGGTLPLSAVWLSGHSLTPRPAVVVAFKVFYLEPGNWQSAVQISDTTLQEGQGMHGGFGRESTYNNMAAIGPDFKKPYVDRAPVSNADIVPTLARLMGIKLQPRGQLSGRVLDEALVSMPDPPFASKSKQASAEAQGLKTVLYFQELGGRRYLDAACLIRSDGESGASDCQ